MEHKEIRRALAMRFAHLLANPAMLPTELRPYQREAIEAVVRWLEDPDGTRRGHVAHATGLGKTVLFASLIAGCAEMRSLIIVPTKALLEQTARTVSRFTRGMIGHLSSLSRIQDDGGEVIAVRGMDHSSVVITTDASFLRNATAIARDFAPQLVIRDECHWGYSESSLAAIAQLEEAVTIAFSATPDYLTTAARAGYVPVTLENGRVFYGPRERFGETHFGPLLDRRTVRWGIESGWLAPLAWGVIDFDVSLDGVRMTEGEAGPDYDQQDLQNLLNKHWSVMCETIRRLYETNEYDLAHRQVFAVCHSVSAAQEIAEGIAALGISAACVTGDTPDAERNVILSAYKANEIRFLSSVMVLREGWDAPNAEVCMMLRPTLSWLLYQQTMGRVLRLPEDGSQKVALVLDAHFLFRKLMPLSAPMLYGAPGTEIPDGGILIDGPGRSPRGGEPSPYLPKNASPRIVVVPALEEAEQARYRAGPDGTFVADGEVWTSIRAMSRQIGVSPSVITVRARAAHCRTRTELSRKGREQLFYAVSDLERVCKDLISAIAVYPEIDRDSVYRNERGPWVSVKRAQQEIGVGEPAIQARLASHPCASMKVRNHGRVIDVYLVSDLRAICADLLDGTLIRLNGKGEGENERGVWCTQMALTKRFAASGKTVAERLGHGVCPVWRGKTRSGHVLDVYLLEAAERLCGDLIHRAEAPSGALVGMFDADDGMWANISALAKRYGVGRPTVLPRLLRGKCPSRKARGGRNRWYDYYLVSEADRLFADLKERQDLPQTEKDGTCSIDREECATLPKLASMFSVTNAAIQRRIRPNTCRMHKAVNRNGRIVDVYSVKDVRRACADLL